MSRISNKVQFLPNDTIFREGEMATSAYLIESGEVEIYRGSEDARHTIVTLGPQALFGEIAIIDRKQRSASAMALTTTTCIVIKEYDFRALMEKSDPFLRRLVDLLIERVRKTNEIMHHT